MKKRIVVAFFVIAGLSLLYSLISTQDKVEQATTIEAAPESETTIDDLVIDQAEVDKVEQVTMTEYASVAEMTIDDKIREAQLIVIGEVKTTLPSKWKRQDEKDAKDATPQEISDSGLFTDSLILIDKTLKGNFDEPIIRVRAFSGETEQVRWINSTQPSYTKGHAYLLMLMEGFGPTVHVDPGFYISINSSTAVYEIIDSRAISADDEWVLEELIAYIENALR